MSSAKLQLIRILGENTIFSKRTKYYVLAVLTGSYDVC